MNIRYSSSNDWTGQTGSNKGFSVFQSMVYGLRAGFKTLRTYSANGYNTIEKIINRWAPPSDGNDTEGYIQFITRNLGIDRNAVLDFRFDIYAPLVRQMAVMESAYRPTDEELNKAWEIM